MSTAVDFLPPNPGELPRGADCGVGLLVVDKPQSLTSNQVLSRVRRIAEQRKVGYVGTLDPMATGLLIFALGKATKLLQYLGSSDKAYMARVHFGVSTDTDDTTDIAVGAAGAGGLTGSVLADSSGAYRGVIHRVSSSFPTTKVAGQRTYALARQGQGVKLKFRSVTISRLELESGLVPHEIDVSIGRAAQETAPRNPGGKNPGATGGGVTLAAADGGRVVVADVDIAVECSAGTYVRALARNLRRDLGTGAHLTALRRTRAGNYGLEAARNLAELGEEVATQGIISIISLGAAVKALFPTLELDEIQARVLGYGQTVTLPSPSPALYNNNQPLAAALDEAGQVIALATPRVGDTAIRVKPTWVLRPAVAAS